MDGKPDLKVIFLVENVFSHRDYDRYGIDFFKHYQIDVQVWDLSPVLHPNYFDQQKNNVLQNIEIITVFHESSKVLKAISALPPKCVVISVVNFTLQSLFVYRALSKKNALLGLLSNNAVPPRYGNSGIAKSLTNKLHDRISLPRIFNAIFRRIPIKSLGGKPANFVIAGGTRSLDNGENKYALLLAPSTEVVWAHTMDYDVFRRCDDVDAADGEEIGIFIDQNFPFHPDRLWKKRLSFDIDIDEYFSTLRSFFTFIEKELGVRIVIAAHPKSDYGELPDYFGGRKVIRGNTAQLVSISRFVITHYSTAINFSILFEKPILLVTTREFAKTFRQGYIQTMSGLLKKHIILANDPKDKDFESEMLINQDAYQTYKEEYIKKNNSPNKLLWEIVTDYLRGHDGLQVEQLEN